MSPIAPVHAPTLDDLLEFEAPVVTAVLSAPNPGEHARDQLRIRVKELRTQLEEAGAPDALIESVERTVSRELDGAPSGCWIGVLADHRRTVVLPLVDAPGEVVGVGQLPRFVPFVHDRFEYRPHVVVRCDRTGADIGRVTRTGRRDSEVHGDEQHVQKVQSGGWSQRRMQNHSEHTWDQNAEEIADAVIAAAEAVDASLVVVTGDEHAVHLVEDHVPESWQDRLVLDHVQPTDAEGDEAVFDHAVTLVRNRAATEVVALLKRFAEERGRDDRAADGVDAVLDALRRGAVDTLLVAGDVDDEVFVSASDPRQVSQDRQLLADAGLDDVAPARLTDAAVAAAAAGGAAVVVVPEHGPDTPNGPLGAILRY